MSASAIENSLCYVSCLKELNDAVVCVSGDFIAVACYSCSLSCSKVYVLPFSSLANRQAKFGDLDAIPDAKFVCLKGADRIQLLCFAGTNPAEKTLLIACSRAQLVVLEWIGSNYDKILCRTLLTSLPKIDKMYSVENWLFLQHDNFIDCLLLDDHENEPSQFRVDGKSSVTASAAFKDKKDTELVFCCRDRRFQVYSLEERFCSYLSPVCGSSPFTHCCVLESLYVFACDDGGIHMYTRASHDRPTLLKCFYLAYMLQSELAVKSETLNAEDEEEFAKDIAVLSMDSTQPRSSQLRASTALEALQTNPLLERLNKFVVTEQRVVDLLAFGGLLLVCSELQLCAISLDSLHLCFRAFYRDVVPASEKYSGAQMVSEHGLVERPSSSLDSIESPVSSVQLIEESQQKGLLVLKSQIGQCINLLDLVSPDSSIEGTDQTVSDIKSLGELVGYIFKASESLEEREILNNPWKRNLVSSVTKKLEGASVCTIADVLSSESLDTLKLCFPSYLQERFLYAVHKLKHLRRVCLLVDVADLMNGGVVSSGSSPLRIRALKTCPKKSATKDRGSSKSAALSRPITYHKSVKSSGYNAPPKGLKYMGGTSAKGSKKKSPKQDSAVCLDASSVIGATPWFAVSKDDVSYSPKTLYEHSGALVSLILPSQYPRHLFSASMDGTIQSFDLSARRRVVGSTLWLGHDRGISSLDFISHGVHRRLLLSSSIDCTVRLWSTNDPESLITIKPPQKHNLGLSDAFAIPRTSVLLFANGAKVEWHSYDLDYTADCFQEKISRRNAVTPIKANLKSQRHRHSKLFELDLLQQKIACQKVTCLALPKSATESVISRSLFVATGNGNLGLGVYDMAQCSWSRTWSILDSSLGQTRSIHHIHAPVDSFLQFTASVGEGIKAWDTRCYNHNRPMFTLLGGHVNRYSTLLKCSLVPGGEYLLCGSEDGRVPLYDLRTRLPITKFSCNERSPNSLVSTVLPATLDGSSLLVAGGATGTVSTLNVSPFPLTGNAQR